MAEHTTPPKAHEHAPAPKEAVKPVQTPVEHKKEKPAVHKVKKELAVAKVSGAPISLKHSMYIGAHIKGKSIDQALKELEEVTRLKHIIPFKGETPHRHGPGIMAGRYPVNAAKAFILALKTLKGNCIVNGLSLEKTRITLVNPSWAFRPLRRGGRKAKRTHLILEAREMQEKHNG